MKAVIGDLKGDELLCLLCDKPFYSLNEMKVDNLSRLERCPHCHRIVKKKYGYVNISEKYRRIHRKKTKHVVFIPDWIV